MKIYVPTLPEAGRLFRFSEAEVWVQEMLQERLRELTQEKTPLSGHVQLWRTNQNVSLKGALEMDLHPTCDRCTKRFEMFLNIPLHRYLVPYFSKPEAKLPDRGQESVEEIELQEEDLDFSTYHNDEINLADILSEEILLALPMRFLCIETCRGLCPRCGVNRNEVSCHCDPTSQGNPFQVLKGVKFREK